jgi:hypothetical protein
MEKKNDIRFAMNQGIILGIILIIVEGISIAFSLLFNIWMTVVLIAIFISLIVWTLKKFRDQENGGLLEYGRGVKIGFLSIAFGALILVFFVFLYYQFDGQAFQEYLEEAKVQAEESFLKLGISEDDVEKFTQESGSQTSLTYAFGRLINNMFGAIVVSLVVAAIMKKKGDPFASAMEEIDNKE